MSRLLVCSEPDLPSVNMRASLMAMHSWEDLGESEGARYMCCGDTYMMSIDDMHIRHDGLDRQAEAFGIKVDEVVVMSKHSARSGKPALTAHPIGNYHDNEFGGRERTLVTPAPALMSDALRRIVSYNDVPGMQTCFEVTHHGPWLEKPTFYIEIGSDESHWGDLHAADTLARVIADLEPHDEYPVVVGVGGGHYAPRFSDLALTHKVNVGHMLPCYQFEGGDDEDFLRMLRDACTVTGTDQVYVHRKSMKKPEEHRVTDLIQSAGYDTPKSAQFDPLRRHRRWEST